MNRRSFLAMAAAAPLASRLPTASAASSGIDMDAVRKEIEALFPWTHPDRGDWMRCATGEHYATYALAGERVEVLAQRLLNTFRVLSQHPAFLKPEGELVCIADERPRYLYWRRYPEITEYERLPESVRDLDGWKRKPKLWKVSARAVVSLSRNDGTQFCKPSDDTQAWRAVWT